MLKQKRKAPSPLECRPCCRTRIPCNCSQSCDRCTERDSLNSRPYDLNVTEHFSSSLDFDAPTDLGSKQSDTSHTEAASLRAFSTESIEWMQVQEELNYLRAQNRKLSVIQGLIRARNWSALEVFGLPSTSKDTGDSKPLGTMEDTTSMAMPIDSFPHQHIASSVQYGPNPSSSSPLSNTYIAKAVAYAFQHHKNPFAATPGLNPHSPPVPFHDVQIPRNSFMWRTLPLVQASPTPSLTVTHCSSESGIARRMLWTSTNLPTEVESTHSPILNWPLEAISHDQDTASNEMISIATRTQGSPHHMETQWSEPGMPTVSLPPDDQFFLDHEPDPEVNVALAYAFRIHPPMVMPGWRSPRPRSSIPSKRNPVMLPNLSTHAPSGDFYSSQWNNNLTSTGQLMAEVSKNDINYSHPTPVSLSNSSVGQFPGEMSHLGQPISKELPIRFTQEMYDTLENFTVPPPSERESPFVNDASHYTHSSFRPRQYNPSKHYTVRR